MSDFVVAIPARYASTRLPGKPLSLIAGEPMIVHVARRAFAAGAREVVVATDDARIAAALGGQPVTVCMTRTDHASGSDRLAECVEQRGWSDDTVVVNLQGDEPLAPASGIRAVAEVLVANDAPMATLATPLASAEELFNPNVVKLVAAGELALYFSRAPIPWPRDGGTPFARRHVGLYAYRAAGLKAISASPPCDLELAEKLEQLRALWLGYRIIVADAVEPPSPHVDTEEDLANIRRLVEGASRGRSR